MPIPLSCTHISILSSMFLVDTIIEGLLFEYLTALSKILIKIFSRWLLLPNIFELSAFKERLIEPLLLSTISLTCSTASSITSCIFVFSISNGLELFSNWDIRKIFSTWDSILAFSSLIIPKYEVNLSLILFFELDIASSARLIVAIGVLNSCEILLIKSLFISESFFCWIIWYKALVEITIIIKVSIKDRVATPIIPDKTYSCFSGNETIRSYFIGLDLSYKKGMEYFGPDCTSM